MNYFKSLIYALIPIFLAVTVSAIVVTPDELLFENVLNNGYAEKTIKIKSDSQEPIEIRLSATEPLKEWLIFEPVPTSVSRNKPAEFKVILRPTNARLGTYQGYVIINAVSLGKEITGSIASATSLKTIVDITDQEITQAMIGYIIVGDVEKNKPFEFAVEIKNQGNIGINPFFQLDIMDLNKTKVLKSAKSSNKSMLPFASDVIQLDLENNLDLGVYWARISAFSEEGLFIGQQVIKFGIVEPGTPISEEKIIVFEEEVPLSFDGLLIIVSFVLMLFITRRIIKKDIGKEK